MAQAHVKTADFEHGAPDTVSASSHFSLHDRSTKVQRENGPGPSIVGGNDIQRADSTVSQSHTLTPSRGGTLKKRQSLSRKNSLSRNATKKESRSASVKSLTFADDVEDHRSEMSSAFFTPVPTSGSPTEVLASRFQVWRKVLKDLITYFRDIQKSYDARCRSLYTLSNVVSNITVPPQLISQGGVSDAILILRDYHKQSIAAGNKAKSIEEDVIVQLTGLRSDLGQKIKEIKGLSGDFKNNVEKETEATRRAVRELQNALESSSTDPKTDPYLIRLGVDRQLGRQIEEENYLHRAFLNLESSGRELESIVMGEIQKAYDAYAGIIKREADEAYEAVKKLRSGPLTIPKDHEWNAFVDKNEHFVDPRLPVRRVENITYPGKDEAAASEVRAGMLERKSKYLKSYTPGWYVLSTTHLHEFKSPDRIASQTPVMSLALTDQKLGAHSSADSTSHKFMLKGRQSGGMHRGHAWVFRAESYDTMLAWFDDIRNLTEKTGAERNAFIQRSHARSVSAGSHNASSISSDGMEEDEADQVPYSATASQAEIEQEKLPERPNPGGRFPSNLDVNNRDSQVPLSPSSNESSGDREIVAAAGDFPGSGIILGASGQQVQAGDDGTNAGPMKLEGTSALTVGECTHALAARQQDRNEQPGAGLWTAKEIEHSNPLAQGRSIESKRLGAVANSEQPVSIPKLSTYHIERHDSKYGDWMGTGAAAVGSGEAIEAYRRQHDQRKADVQEEQAGLQAVEPRTIAGAADAPQSVQGPIFSAMPSSDSAAHGAAVLSSPHLNDPAEPVRDLVDSRYRPSLAKRVHTISDLHLPGEFPRGKTPADSLAP